MVGESLKKGLTINKLKGIFRSLVKRVSLNFFHFMKALKKALLGMWQLGCNSMGYATWQATF